MDKASLCVISFDSPHLTHRERLGDLSQLTQPLSIPQSDPPLPPLQSWPVNLSRWRCASV